MFLKNRNISSKIKRSKVTDDAALKSMIINPEINWVLFMKSSTDTFCIHDANDNSLKICILSRDGNVECYKCLHVEVRFTRASSHVAEFNTHNKLLTKTLLKRGYQYNKLCKTFS